MDEDRNTPQSGDETLLQEIRDRYGYAVTAWEDVRKERRTDMRYICGDPWDPQDKKARADAGRPAINHDELNQYINQGVNNLRQNRRGIKVDPAGNGASDKTAELRQDLIRTIEYRSKAQSAYLRAGQDMYEGSYGFFRITRKYVDTTSFDQEIVIKIIPNPDSVLYDPDCKEADWSDAAWVFVVEPMSKEEFKRRYPRAQRTDFTTEDMRIAKDWVQDKTILVAEYWKVITTTRELIKGKKRRTVEEKKVVQYITNGVEVLDEIEQPGEDIPIPAMIGLERYVDEGAGPKRMLFSLPRLAREPQMSLAYLVSQEMEEAGMSPKVPVMGYTGQFETDADAWATLNKVPRSFVQVDPLTEATGQQVLPLPQFRQFVPNFQQYEIAKDAARRAIQAAMGISPLPTAAQRQNEKSGVALENIQTEQAIGSYHFVDGFDRALERAGRIIESWIPATYDSEDREMGLQRPDDSRRVVRLNTSEPYVNEKTGQEEHFPIGDEAHDVTVSTGPSYQSQREAVGEFLNTLIGNLGKLPIPPPQAAKLLALAIQMKDLGPKGDEMAEIISPTQGDQSQQLAGLQQQMQQQGAVMQEMQGELQKLQLEKQGKVIDNEYKMALEKMKIEAQTAAAEINTKAQSIEERMKFVEDLWQQLHGQAHEAGMAAEDREHEQGMQQQQQDAAQQQQVSDQVHQTSMAQQQAEAQPAQDQ